MVWAEYAQKARDAIVSRQRQVGTPSQMAADLTQLTSKEAYAQSRRAGLSEQDAELIAESRHGLEDEDPD